MGDNKGGARPGAGRPLGAVSKRSRAAADRLSEDGGVTPVDVMISNMRFAHEAALAASADLAKADKRSYKRTLVEVIRFRQISEEAAKDAAPYMHPRLASIEVSGDQTVRHVISATPLTEAEFEAEIAARDGAR